MKLARLLHPKRHRRIPTRAVRHRKSLPSRTQFRLESLEPRLLLSTTPLPIVALELPAKTELYPGLTTDVPLVTPFEPAAVPEAAEIVAATPEKPEEHSFEVENNTLATATPLPPTKDPVSSGLWLGLELETLGPETSIAPMSPAPAGETGEVRWTDATGQPVRFYQTTEAAVYVEVVDRDVNADPGQAETVTVMVTSQTETAGGVTEPVPLTETGPNTGVFRGSILLSVGGTAGADGQVAAAAGDTVRVTYADTADDFGNPVTVEQVARLVGTIVPGGTLPASTTWALAGGPYLITGDLRVPAGHTLTVEPGVTVLFAALSDDQASGWWQNLSELIIQAGGTLTAAGTPEAPITFTSSEGVAAVGEWGAIRFEAGSGTLRYVAVSGAQYGVYTTGMGADPLLENGVYAFNQTGIFAGWQSAPRISGNQVTDNGAGIQVSDAPATVSNNAVSDNRGAGILAWASNAANRATITGNSVTGNQSSGIALNDYGAAVVDGNTITGNYTGIAYNTWSNLGEAYPVITGNTITGNQGPEVQLFGPYPLARVNYNTLYDTGDDGPLGSYDFAVSQTTAQIDARFNYWGPATTAEMAAGGNPKNIARIFDFYDNAALGRVNYAGWLDGENGTPTPAGMTGEVRWTDAAGQVVRFYQTAEAAVSVEVVDRDVNTDPGQAETVTVGVTSETETAGGVTEPVLLTETGIDTGVFQGAIPLRVGAPAGADGQVAAAAGDTVRVTYADAADDFGNPATVEQVARLVGTVVPGGTLSASTTWALAGGPYLITGDLRITAGHTLTVEPGVTVLFAALSDDQASGWWGDRSELIIEVGGTLTAAGTPEAPITFTSSEGVVEAGEWGAIRFEAGSGTLRYVEVSGAQYGVYTTGMGADPLLESGVYAFNQTGLFAGWQSAPRISGNQVTDNWAGIQVSDAPATVSNNAVSDNRWTGIYASAYSVANRATITGNSISGNQYSGIDLYNYGAAVVDGNTITGNAYAGISYNNYSSNLGEAYPVITGNTITGNQGTEVQLFGAYALARVNHNTIYDTGGGPALGSYDLVVGETTAQIDARFNYWGPVTTAEMAAGGNPKNIARIYDFYDYAALGRVNYAGWLATDYLSYPTLITVSPNDHSLLLQWNRAVGAAGYQLQYGTTSGVYDVTVDTGDVAHYLITGLTNGTPYYIVLKSHDADGNQSPSSAEVSGVPAPVSTNPRVVASSIAAGDVIATGDLVYQVRFSEELATAGLGPEDVTLVDRFSGRSVSPADFVYDTRTSTATVTYRDLSEGAYTVTLVSAATAFRSSHGLLLDGTPSFPLPSGDGLPGDPFVVHFSIDSGITAYPVPLETVEPHGSLIYERSASGAFHAIDDVDVFTVDLDADQTVTLRLTPHDASILGRVELVDPSGNLVREFSATTGGETVIMETVPISEAGPYTLRLSSVAGTGAYEVDLVLNATLETEGYAGGSNDTTATAQDLSGSAVALQGAADRLAVLGESDEGGDIYRFELTAGQAASLVLTWLDTLNGLALELLDPAGTLMAMGVEGAENVDQAIREFVTPAAGIYYARVSGDASVPYSLVLTRGADFELEPNTQAVNAQDISLTGQAVGSLGVRRDGSGAGGTIRVAVHAGSLGGEVVAQLNNDTFFDFDAVAVTGSQIDTVEELNAYDVVVIGDYTREAELDTLAPALRAWVETGGGVVGTGWLIYSAGTSSGLPVVDIDAIIPVNTSGSYNYLSNPTLTIQAATHLVTQGLGDFAVGDYVEYSSGGVDAGATVLATAGGQAAVVVGTPGGLER